MVAHLGVGSLVSRSDQTSCRLDGRLVVISKLNHRPPMRGDVFPTKSVWSCRQLFLVCVCACVLVRCCGSPSLPLLSGGYSRHHFENSIFIISSTAGRFVRFGLIVLHFLSCTHLSLLACLLCKSYKSVYA